MLVVLDAEFADLPVDGLDDFGLGLRDSLADRGIPSYDMQRAPGEQAGDRVKVRGEDVASELRGLEWDRSAAAEGIAHPGPFPEPQHAKLLDQLGEAPGTRPEMGVHTIPDRPEQGVVR